ncbi:MAG TPA: sigma-70 family RNA polymerase sigma factor [Pyrinomonadaceae bacterium]|nr:sigma-70 family RNA polymerase sigma factor [Pyrinomonadaceae bacterium]
MAGIKSGLSDIFRLKGIRLFYFDLPVPEKGMIFKSSQQTSRTGWEAFEEEALPHLPGLFRLAMWLVRDRAEAEDLVQETFTQALQSFHRFEKGTNCRAWLVRVMYFTNNNRRRANARLRLISENDERIAETVVSDRPTPQGLTAEEVLSALRSLPRQFQDVVILSDVEDMSYKQIAETLGVPVGTVMSRLHRGRKRMRAELANEAGCGRKKPNDGTAASSSRN